MEKVNNLFEKISKRYGNVEAEALEAILTPILIPVTAIDKVITKSKGESHWKASFSIKIEEQWAALMQKGTTGKFVPQVMLKVVYGEKSVKGD